MDQPVTRVGPPPGRQLGVNCLVCLEQKPLSLEHALASQLFTYPDAPRVQTDCLDCNKLLGECEADFERDPFVQQAKKALYPISFRDSDRKGWKFQTELAHHYAKPGFQCLYGPDGEVASVTAPDPTDEVWRAVGKSMLVSALILVGNDVFHPSLDLVRKFVHLGGSAWDAGLRRGPNPKQGQWDDYHEIRAVRISPEKSALFIDLFARYSFYLECGVPLLLPENALAVVFRCMAATGS